MNDPCPEARQRLVDQIHEKIGRLIEQNSKLLKELNKIREVEGDLLVKRIQATLRGEEPPPESAGRGIQQQMARNDQEVNRLYAELEEVRHISCLEVNARSESYAREGLSGTAWGKEEFGLGLLSADEARRALEALKNLLNATIDRIIRGPVYALHDAVQDYVSYARTVYSPILHGEHDSLALDSMVELENIVKPLLLPFSDFEAGSVWKEESDSIRKEYQEGHDRCADEARRAMAATGQDMLPLDWFVSNKPEHPASVVYYRCMENVQQRAEERRAQLETRKHALNQVFTDQMKMMNELREEHTRRVIAQRTSEAAQTPQPVPSEVAASQDLDFSDFLEKHFGDLPEVEKLRARIISRLSLDIQRIAALRQEAQTASRERLLQIGAELGIE